ncbi:MAG: hypothetical protein Q7K03_02795 [Dehalococcoidia bacterium]|nr:hypothetical protein [Dehalococcoidia bacterium]
MFDHFLPNYDFREVHVTAVRVGRDRVYRAIKEIRSGEIPLLWFLFALRALPALLTRRGKLPFGGDQPFLDQMIASGFVLLAEETDRQLVLGTVGQFWRALERPLQLANASEFLAFDRPAYAKAVTNFFIAESLGRTGVVLTTETRIHVPSPAARRKFAAYWFMIRLPSGLLRRMILRAIKIRAEGHQLASS